MPLRKLLLLIPVIMLLAACDSAGADIPPTFTEQQVRGQNLYDSYCSRCHSRINGETIVGPSFYGLASRAGDRVEGLDAEAYIRQSIMEPTAYTVEGFTEGLMPASLAEELEPDQVDAIVSYLLTLK